jgi:WD40 repeat protein
MGCANWCARRTEDIKNTTYPERPAPLAFSSDGSRVVVASGQELEVLDGMTGSLIGDPIVGHTDTVKFLSLSRDGQTVVSSTGSSTVRVWDGITGTPVSVNLGGHINHVTSIDISPNRRQILSSSEDGTVRIWDATLRDPAAESVYSGRNAPSVPMAAKSDTSLLAISENGLQVVFKWQGALQLIDGTSGEPSRETFAGWHEAIALSSYGHFLAFCERQSASSRGSRDGRVGGTTLFYLSRQPVPENLGWQDRITVPTGDRDIVQIAFSSDEKKMVLCSEPASLQLWDVMKCRPIGPVFGGDVKPARIVSVAFSPDGSRLASALNDSTVRLWDTAAFSQIGEPLLRPRSWRTSIRFSRDGRFLVAWAWDLHRCWDVESLTEVDNHRVTISEGIVGLNERTGWVESVDACSKLWQYFQNFA